MTVRLIVADDNFLVREGTCRLLGGADRLEVVAACADYDQTVSSIAATGPDVVLTDIRMPPTRTDEGLRIAEVCRSASPPIGVLLLSQYAEAGYVKALLARGTEGRGYLLKERVGDLDELVQAIEAVAAGGSAIDPKVVEALVAGRARGGSTALASLSPREREVLAAIAQGKTNTAIAGSLFLSQRAVEKHINSIFAKLDLSGDQHNHPRVRAALMFLADDGG
ncbi:response regulator transcription factor [Microlunatus ginsengisoli]|uniref:Response regulator transcription factor n=1 Tax=Microlunatus ginsengisoli TaxID=363863 RepID=A0ABP6ZRT1_9ACTN